MRVNFVFTKLLVWYLVTIILSQEDDCGCREDMKEGVLWPTTSPSTCVKSSPLCIGENMEILTRCCDAERNWEDSPECHSFQETVKSPCPDDFITNLVKNSCIFVINYSTYPPKCPYEETLPFNEYINDIDPSWLPVWMPVVRSTGKYGLDLLRWMEPSLDYKLAYTECIEDNCSNYHFSGSLKTKNCLIFYNSSYVEAVSCDEKHTAICAYKSLPNRIKSFCSQSFPWSNKCVQSDYSTKSKCFCKDSMNRMSIDTKAEFLQPYQNLLYPSLSNEVCQIGLKRNQDNYIWSNSNAIINYTYWAGNTNFGKQYKYGVISLNGWMLTQTDTESKCSLYQVEPPKVESEIILKYDEEVEKFSVNLTNPASWISHENDEAPMVFCFTDAASDTLISRMEVGVSAVSTNFALYSFAPHGDGPGTYWCEGFLYPEIVSKSSNQFLLRYSNNSREEYVVILKTNYTKSANPLTNTNLQFFRDLLANQIISFPMISNFVTRIYKIVDIDEENSEITINFHVVNPADSEPLKLYSALRGYLEQNLSEFIFINVFGVDSCVGIQTVDLSHTATWPITKINEVAVKPREGYCLKSDGSIMTRRCYGDYINGAQWSELDEPCNIQESTNITVNLTNIIALNNPKDFAEQVAEVAADHANLTPLDIHLISKFLEQLANSGDIDIMVVVKIIDQLMNVPEDVLKESQIEFNATDRILYYTDQIIINSKYIGELTEDNFFLISYHIKDSNLSGIVLKSYSEIYFTIYKIFNFFDLNEIKRIDNLNAAVVLSQSLMDYIYRTQDYDSRIIVIVYKNSKFFSEEKANIKNAGMIMGVLLPDLEEQFLGEIFTIYNNSDLVYDFNCSFWSYDLDVKKGSWEYDVQKSDGQSAVFCIYNHLTHLGLVQKEEFNITNQLKSILSSPAGLTEKLTNASSLLSNYYEDFQPIDVMLISSLLREATLASEDNLDLVADIVNKVIDIPTEILEKSQAMFNATGKILSYFDEILQQYGSAKMIQKENFYAVVQLLRDENVRGFILNNCASKCNLTLLRTEAAELEVSLVENLDSAMIISQELVDQLREISDINYTPKIVTTIFFHDTLFIEDYANTKITSKVIGVFLPNFDEPFNGNIKLLYNVNLNITSNYTCAVYYNDSNDTTYEKGFWNAENPPIPIDTFLECQFWKPKYFALVYNLFNITAILENLLNSQESTEVILHQTDVIADNYNDSLQALDIFIIAQLLSKVAEVNSIIVEMCLNIVSNIMKVSKSTLRESQQIYNATNMILYYFNRIAQNHDSNKAIYKDNVIVIVSLVSESGMFGISLENCDKQCDITLLYENVIDGTSTDLDNFDTELKINQNLIDQLLYYEDDDYIPKLILTVYYNDALFNGDNGKKKTGKIFGVSLPNFNRILSHEIKLYFNMSAEDASKGYDCAAWNYREGKWAYESQARGLDRLSCNFYQQNYFTLIAGNAGYDNITSALTDLSNSTAYFPEKLYKTEDVSYYYSEFKSVDVGLLAGILSQCDRLSENGLYTLSIIVNNILRMPSSVLHDSEDQYGALTQILNNIVHTAHFQKPNEFSSIDGPFILVVCQTNSTKNSVIVTPDEVRCTSYIDINNVSDTDNTLAVITLDENVFKHQVPSQGYQLIVRVFLNDVLFGTSKLNITNLILGVSIPSLGEELEGDVTIFFNSKTHNPTYDCAYWDYDINSWNFIDDTTGAGLFMRCNFKQLTYFALVENENKAINVTKTLIEIMEGDFAPSEKLSRTLNAVTRYMNLFEAIHVYFVAQILSYLDEVELIDLKVTAEITNLIMGIPRSVLVDSQTTYNATDLILYQVDRIAQRYNDITEIIRDNFVVIITSNITGISIEGCATSCDVRILREEVDLTSLENNWNTALVLDEELRRQLVDDHSLSKIFVTIYFTDALFNEGHNRTYTNIGQIIGIVMPSIDQDMKGPLRFYYYTESNNTEFCAFWNYTVEEDDRMRGHWERNETSLPPSRVSLCESTHTTHFALLETDKNVTNDLENILNSDSPTKSKLKKVLSITLDLPNKLLPVDIYLISQILNYAIGDAGTDEMYLTAHIISHLFYVKRDILRESQLRYDATDKILHSIDEMAKLMDELDGEPIVYENFVVAVYDLKETNTSGLVLENCNSTMCSISALENTVNLTKLSDNEHLETAIALSDELLDQVRQSGKMVKLVVTIFFSDVLFNEESPNDMKTTMICGVLLPGFEEFLAGNIYIMFNTARDVNYNNSCAYWNYKVSNHESIVRGSWKTDAGPSSKDHFAICEFDHITHFALLLANDNSSYIDANAYNILDIITAVNCLLSLVGILGILLTAVLFERWRKNTGNQILLNFSIAISIKIVMLYVSVDVYESHSEGVMCAIMGAILHFAMLSEFCWMLIIAILQFKRFVEVLGGPPKYVLLKACVCGWVFPILPVMLILIIDTENYTEGQVGLCYPSGLGLYLGIWLPLIIIVTINFVIFIFIIYNVFHKKTETRDLVNHEILFQWRLALLLFSMLGLTWLFGFLSQIQGAYIFVYLFSFTSTLQGFIMFLFFIVFNQSTRFLYSQSIKLWLYSRGYKVQ